MLAFGHEFEITNYAPQYLLDYREETVADRRWNDRIVSQSGDWSGNLVDFYYRVTERLLQNFKAPFSTDESGTVHGSRNPAAEAVNEAVANALVHAYYGSSGSVRIVMKADELTVSNPGSLLVDSQVAIAGGFSEARNPTLMRIFSFVGVSDRAGSGLHQIWTTWSSFYEEMPRLEERHSPAGVTLRLPLVEAGGRSRSVQERAVVSDAEILLAVKYAASGVTPQQIHEELGLSTRSAQERLKALYEAGALDRVKDGRFYRYCRK